MSEARRGRWIFAAAVTLAYLAVAGFALAKHEMWRDELHCWLVARDCAAPWDVVRARAYDGQPPLWYLLLWALTRVTWHPEAMRAVHLGIAATNVLLFARFAPFGRPARALFAFGYFAAYEYAAISRCYGLALLFAILLCIQHARRHDRPLAVGGLLAGLALTTTVGTLAAAAYAAALAIDQVGAVRRGERPPATRWIPVGLAALGGLAAGLCAWPPSDSTVAHIGVAPEMPWDFAPTRVVAALVPVPRDDFFFWNSNALLWSIGSPAIRFAIAAAIFGWGVFVLWRDRFATILFVLGTVLVVGLVAGVYSGSVRHHGFIYVLWTMAAWIAWTTRRRRVLAPTLTLALLVQVPGTAIAMRWDTQYVFSSGARAADVLRAHGWADALIVAEVDYPATAMLGQLGPRAFAFSPRTGRSFSFVRWTQDRQWDPTDADDIRYSEELAQARDRDVVLVMNRPLLPELVDGERVVRVAELFDSMIEEENFYVYRVPRPIRAGASLH
jgi:hypothetical protein